MSLPWGRRRAKASFSASVAPSCPAGAAPSSAGSPGSGTGEDTAGHTIWPFCLHFSDPAPRRRPAGGRPSGPAAAPDLRPKLNYYRPVRQTVPLARRVSVARRESPHSMSRDPELIERIRAHQFFHTMDLGDGLVTNGDSNPNDLLSSPGLAARRARQVRARYRCLGRQVLLQGRSRRRRTGGGARPLRVAAQRAGPPGLLRRVRRQGAPARPRPHRPRLPPRRRVSREEGLRHGPRVPRQQGGDGHRRLHDDGPRHVWVSSTSSSTSACCTT